MEKPERKKQENGEIEMEQFKERVVTYLKELF